MSVFYMFPTRSMTLKDISIYTRLAHTSVKQNLRKLIKVGLIVEKIEKKGKRKFPVYETNSSNKLFVRYKKIYNLQVIIESCVIEYLEEKLMPKCIVLFGSYQRGEDTEESDIDLFVEGKQEDIQLRPFEKRLGRKIEVHFKEHFGDYSKELKNNMINGVVLHGFLEGY